MNMYTNERPRSRSSAPSRVNGWPAVHRLASMLKSVPKEKQDVIRKLWRHVNKKRIRLERLGGQNRHSGRGFVIDGHTVVDGLTKRMEDLLSDYSPYTCTGKLRFMKAPLALLLSDESIQQSLKTCQKNDKAFPSCKEIRGNPMQHGSKVHNEVYNAVRHAIRIAKIYTDNRPLPRNFDVDVCTNACLLSMVKFGLAPFSSEWPAFYEKDTGCATAADILALDVNDHFKMTIVELKTGSVVQAMRTPREGQAQWNGMLSAVIQNVTTAAMCRVCYGPEFFSWSDTTSCVIYARPWGCVKIEIPPALWSPAIAGRLCRILAERKRGSLRETIPEKNNQQSFNTSKGKKRIRAPKTFEVGFRKS